MTSSIIATGSYVPPKKVHNTDLEKIMDTNDAWIQQRTGIETRHYEDISTVHMATQAARKALETVDIESIDCIMVATYTPDSFIPGVANLVRAQLKPTRSIPSFDLNAACSGFMYAFQTAHAYLKAGIYQRVLVIGVDFNSRYLDFTDRSTAILFGDGAGAVVMEADDSGTIDCVIGSETDTEAAIVSNNATDYGNPFIDRPTAQKAYFSMKGQLVFKFAVNIIENMTQSILKQNNLTVDAIDCVIAHQANQRILDHASRKLGIAKERFHTHIQEYGNTSSGSVPILLDQAYREGKLKEGMCLLLMAFGGGLTFGVSLVTWKLP